MHHRAVCATNNDLCGYFKIAQLMSSWYCRVNFGRCAALAKIILSILCKHWPGDIEDFALTDSEMSYIFELVSNETSSNSFLLDMKVYIRKISKFILSQLFEFLTMAKLKKS